MLFWDKIKSWFKKKPSQEQVVRRMSVKLVDLKLEQEDHSEILVHLLDQVKQLREEGSVVKNALANMDNRTEQLENVSSYLFKTGKELDNRVERLEDDLVNEEFEDFVNTRAPSGSSDN